ncbi:thrombospondin type 3 repeat-containing protein [Saprospiraceae bacterium]|nr:thrombospondin type 3 repeat-containing protein [Saprospiraceae bacterium]
MRNSILITFLLIGFAFSLSGQNQEQKIGLSFKKLFLDYQSQNGGSITALRNYHSGYEIGFNYNVQKSLNIVVPIHVGVPSHNLVADSYHRTIFGAGVHVQYQFYKPQSVVVPYLVAGLSGVGETGTNGSFNLQAPVGLGLNFKIRDRGYINWESTFRKSFSSDRDNLHHGIGFVYLLGNGGETMKKPEKKADPNDADEDGIPDELDLCPQIAGPEALKGCPDSDGDGVADYEDACPSYAGLASLNGCPDSDGDGVSDKDDECPNLAGTIANKGCPSADRDNDGVADAEDKCPDLAGDPANGGCPSFDSDNDGISDDVDKCPNNAGPASTSGCPDRDRDGVADFADKCPDQAGIAAYNGCPDTDGDGIDDSRDKCPNSAGSVANNGCPEISKEDLDVLELAMRAVQFDSGKASLKSQSSGILNQIAGIMVKYPDFNLSISGHTDNTGSPTNNQNLSEKRAKSCYDFLARAGVSTVKMNYAGYGESRPIADNNTLRGRALNRRVEFNLIPR